VLPTSAFSLRVKAIGELQLTGRLDLTKRVGTRRVELACPPPPPPPIDGSTTSVKDLAGALMRADVLLVFLATSANACTWNQGSPRWRELLASAVSEGASALRAARQAGEEEPLRRIWEEMLTKLKGAEALRADEFGGGASARAAAPSRGKARTVGGPAAAEALHWSRGGENPPVEGTMRTAVPLASSTMATSVGCEARVGEGKQGREDSFPAEHPRARREGSSPQASAGASGVSLSVKVILLEGALDALGLLPARLSSSSSARERVKRGGEALGGPAAPQYTAS